MSALPLRIVFFFGILLWTGPVISAEFKDRDTAFAPESGEWSVGIFNPLEIQLSDAWGFQVHPLAFFGAPHLELHHSVFKGTDWALKGLYGLSVPSWALKYEPPFGLRGYFSPKCVVSQAEPERSLDCGQDAWVIVPKIGAQYSKGQHWVMTLEADIAAGIVLAGERPRPLDTYAPIEMLFAPMTHEYRVHFGARISRKVTSWLLTMAEVDLYRVGELEGRSPWTLSLYSGLDFRMSSSLRGTLGIIYWNDDQRAMVLTKDAEGFSRKEMVRSHDVFPTIDLIWTY